MRSKRYPTREEALAACIQSILAEPPEWLLAPVTEMNPDV